MACVVNPLSLARLSAFAVVEQGIEWEGKVDELSIESIEKAKKEIPIHGVNYRRGKIGPFLSRFMEVINILHRTYFLPHCRERLNEDFNENLLLSFPTPDTVQRMSQKTKDQLFEILLFWEFSTPELISEQFVSALCE
uniref:Uncharacterized protein n=1 Tax=Marseillevirus sp. TaxID=2809551 RepID=A0AA96EP75_9VIRU|nr:hypothetical protein MarFTMF_190 [Marseillevirus sp.]